MVIKINGMVHIYNRNGTGGVRTLWYSQLSPQSDSKEEKRMLYDLNEKTTEIYGFICDFNRANGYSPSVREIEQHVGMSSTSTVHSYLKRLEECGYITRKKDCPGTIQIV